jgi:hypothetical protein
VTTQNKQQYRFRNWQEYNKALVARGSLTLCIDARAIDKWLSLERPARRGRRPTSTDLAVECCLLLREGSITWRCVPRKDWCGQSCGCSRSTFPLLIIRRSPEAPASRPLSLAADTPKTISHLVIDSSGLKVYGEGEWKVRVHGADKRRTWRKLHISMDAETYQVTAALLTDKDALDPTTLPALLKQTEAEIRAVCADGADDFEQCYRAIKESAATALIPPDEML